MFTTLNNHEGFHSIFTATLRGRTLSFQCFSEQDSNAFVDFAQDVDTYGDQMYEAEDREYTRDEMTLSIIKAELIENNADQEKPWTLPPLFTCRLENEQTCYFFIGDPSFEADWIRKNLRVLRKVEQIDEN